MRRVGAGWTSPPLGWLAGLLIALLLLAPAPILPSQPALAGSVDWQEVPANSDGRQWWDAGSLRLTRNGNLSVLSRFQPAAAEEERPHLGDLYVMEIDCGQQLYRDTSVNGLPRLGAEWQPASGDDLISAVIDASCDAGAALLQAA
ncbi:hypothetical protein [Cyanobium sp. NIES-981]|uniref:hypothetical protein n=1 Tax=Cyanobium sp. NIES-981 TaxID=1851505 RepID=UPI0007DD2090|nr:hypothetical protein [Cyanobium sp. NIES-981]SBO41965.1 conserved protein of unknown function [Cyanobium sp. NIES-981]